MAVSAKISAFRGGKINSLMDVKLNRLGGGGVYLQEIENLRTHLGNVWWLVFIVKVTKSRIIGPNIPVGDYLDWRAILTVGEAILWAGNPELERTEKMRWVPTFRYSLLSLTDCESHGTNYYKIPLPGLWPWWTSPWSGSLKKQTPSPLRYFGQSV